MVSGSFEGAPSLPYHEPGIVVILTQASFLLLLNIVNTAIDRIFYCGLLGQVLVGIAWGTPAAKLLSTNVEEVVVQFGYLGLILLVFEGGLHTSFQSLKANLYLSSGVALTGIAMPIGFSFALQGLLNATPLQAFAAGAALCSTSLGTTFTVLGSSGLSSSRLGVVLTSAAMMDDIVGLVMVQVISNLGGDSFSWIVIVRPVLVSIAFAMIVPATCLLALKPAATFINHHREAHPKGWLDKLLKKTQTAFVFHTTLLIGLVTGATYAGTSNLFAAYTAGAVISWWDSELPHPDVNRTQVHVHKKTNTIPTSASRQLTTGRQYCDVIEGSTHATIGFKMNESSNDPADIQPSLTLNTLGGNQDTSGSAIFHQYYHPAVSKILQPLFFASIGFSIPITRMFRGAIVWRGIVYSTLMIFAKAICGLWLVRFSTMPGRESPDHSLAKLKQLSVPHLWRWGRGAPKNTKPHPNQTEELSRANTSNQLRCNSPNPPKPFSLHPPLILALAMCARGEIGFLISGVAESNKIFSSPEDTFAGSSDIFLVVTWAIVLCTIVGPLGVGLSIRRVRSLQNRKEKQQKGSGRDVLGVWGV